MARKQLRPGRSLIVFFTGLVVLLGLTFLGEQTNDDPESAGKWQPALGLDLQGGTRITLVATNDPTTESLEEARKIIDDRVNGSGVAEAEVTTQSGKYIIVEIPGDPRGDLVDTVKRQAQLRFRLVACSTNTGGCTSTATDPTALDPSVVDPSAPVDPNASLDPSAVPEPVVSPGAGVLLPSAEPSAGTETGVPTGGVSIEPSGGSSEGTSSASELASPSGTAPRAPVSYVETTPSAGASTGTTGSAKSNGKGSKAAAAASPSADASSGAAPTADATPGVDATATADATAPGAATGPIAPPDGGEGAKDPLTWSTSPNQESIDAYDAFSCPVDGSPANVVDDPEKPLVTCGTGDELGVKYLLSPAMIEGTQLSDASAGIPQNGVSWAVNLDFNGAGTKEFTKISQALFGTERLFAIVLDGQVLSSPTMNGIISNGDAQITGNFNQETATSLATSLKFGALPIAFERNPTTELVGPSLAGDQLSAGILAGAIGLFLVMLYALLYYRGLGLVVISSLVVAAALTYLLVLLLGTTAGFTLTLPGIAGLIIGVGVTADSFIIFFERIRDEMREGKSMRVAVETGWVRARKTRMAANVVSLLSALVLYIFATGVVKGFGFALGLSTLIDLAVLFWFTKPFVSYLARFRFFNGGGELSGLSVATLGMDSPRESTREGVTV